MGISPITNWVLNKCLQENKTHPSPTNTFPVARFWKPFPNPSTHFMIEFLKIPKTPKMTLSSKRSTLKISLSVLSRWLIMMMYSVLNKKINSLDLRESRKWSEISVMSSLTSKWKGRPLSSMRMLSLFSLKCLEPSKIKARSMMATENEISFLPGIPAEKFMGKRFETMHLAVHRIRDGKIKQNYHIEDWSTAIHQMLYNRPAPDFGFERDFVDF